MIQTISVSDSYLARILHSSLLGIFVLVHKVPGGSYRFMLLIWVGFQSFKVGVRKEYQFLGLTAFGVVTGSLVYQLINLLKMLGTDAFSPDI